MFEVNLAYQSNGRYAVKHPLKTVFGIGKIVISVEL